MWAVDGFDHSCGRFVERLDLAGAPLPVPHRAMVQARQIYVFARAAALGWYPEGGMLAETAMASLRRDFCADGAEQASVAFSIDPLSGRIVSATRDSYTTAFVLFATAHLYALNHDSELLGFAERLTAHIERDLIDRNHGGVIDADTSPYAPKRQNPQMHLLEAYLALETVASGQGYIERAGDLVNLFHDRLVSTKAGVLLEHFSADWRAHPDPSLANLFEPGHHYEWVWLLDQFQRLSGSVRSAWVQRLHDSAQRYGHAPSGMIFDTVTAGSKVAAPSHRLWPHTEAIKAAAAQHRLGDVKALPFADRMASVLAEHFLDAPFVGGWTDQVALDGARTVAYVPASSLYHLFHAATEAAAAFEPTEL